MHSTNEHRAARRIVSTSTGIEHAISVSATCKSSHVVYVIQCIRCKLQYVGETEQALHERMNSHSSDIRLAKTKGKPVAAHFCGRECKINDLTVAGVDKTPPGDTVLRNTVSPDGYGHYTQKL